ncbi:CLC4M protein, partial [Atractosteus spatula]|nr:CLC4M protein [Atractosteus spatula]
MDHDDGYNKFHNTELETSYHGNSLFSHAVSVVQQEVTEVKLLLLGMNSSKAEPQGATLKQTGDCGEGWIQFQMSCYLMATQKNSWHDAQTACVQERAHLLVINTAEEQHRHPDHHYHTHSHTATCLSLTHTDTQPSCPSQTHTDTQTHSLAVGTCHPFNRTKWSELKADPVKAALPSCPQRCPSFHLLRSPHGPAVRIPKSWPGESTEPQRQVGRSAMSPAEGAPAGCLQWLQFSETVAAASKILKAADSVYSPVASLPAGLPVFLWLGVSLLSSPEEGAAAEQQEEKERGEAESSQQRKRSREPVSRRGRKWKRSRVPVSSWPLQELSSRFLPPSINRAWLSSLSHPTWQEGGAEQERGAGKGGHPTKTYRDCPAALVKFGTISARALISHVLISTAGQLG